MDEQEQSYEETCLYCESRGELKFFSFSLCNGMVGDVNYSKPKSISRTYKCPVCKYEWVHDIATGENYRDSPREYNPKEKKGIAA